MEYALRLRHGKRPHALSEVTAYPHLEVLATTDEERETLKVLADQLRAFGAVPFSYKEMESVTGALHGAQLRVALHERDETRSGEPARAPAGKRPRP
jgi:hypothetical protein